MKQLKLFGIIVIVFFSLSVNGQNPKHKLKKFSSKTKEYYINVELQFSDTALIGFTLTGNCKKACNFSINGQLKKMGNIQNVSIPNGNNIITTSYGYFTDDYTFYFEISEGNNTRIKLKGIQVTKDKHCEECFHNIIIGQLIKPLEEKKE